jgi:hypothetical protein
MTVKVIGTCGNCGGPVCVPTFWYGIYPPTPSCTQCNAVPKHAHGPVIPMEKPSRPKQYGEVFSATNKGEVP